MYLSQLSEVSCSPEAENLSPYIEGVLQFHAAFIFDV